MLSFRNGIALNQTGRGSNARDKTASGRGFLASAGAAARAQDDAAELAKQLSNPIANLISVPFQFNAQFGAGPDDDGQSYILNIQPVVPLRISPELNLIVRTILPVVGQVEVFPDDVWGLGDTTQSFFLSPSAPGPGGLVWGVGPVFLYPTATDSELGTGKWGAGPTGVALLQSGKWTTGILANHIWSIGGDEDRADVNQTFLQPFVAYALGGGQTLSANIQATYNWKADQWSAPLTAGYSKVFKIGRQAMSWQLGGTVFLVTPDNGPTWGVQGTLTFLFPTGR